ncbi:MAG: hypothetical protein KA436_09745 [Oligoflexales bacterium]|nr:hypothetical protein [Oligoflexales bacterium]
MGQNKGCKKAPNSGRKSGTPNKRSIFSVSSRLSELDYDIVEKILDDIQAISAPELRVKAHFQLLEYCDAKRKTIEVTQKPIDLSSKSISEKIALGKEAIKFLEEKGNFTT